MRPDFGHRPPPKTAPERRVPSQLPLPLGAPPPTPRPQVYDNLFFAIRPDEEAKARIEALAAGLRRAHGLRAMPLPPGRLHVSLQPVGCYAQAPAALIAAAERAGAAVRARPFRVVFDRVLSFKNSGRPPLVLGVGDGLDALTAFHGALGAEMTRVGLGGLVRSRFTPHLTLLYGDRMVGEMRIEPIVCAVRDFVLIKSLFGRSRHIALARWPLRG
jgi:2'-5' RNA ligase